MSQSEKTIQIHDKNFKIYLTRVKILEYVKQLSEKINRDLKDKNPVFLIVLKGSVFFAADLLREFKYPCSIETIGAKSYGNSTVSSGQVTFYLSSLYLKDRHVIIIEDIVDTGLTLKSLINKLKEYEPASIEAVAFLSKPDQRKVEVPVKYIGLEIQPEFVVGYGLDYAEVGRNLGDIYTLIEE